MKSGLIVTRHEAGSPEWEKYRTGYLNSSEAASILGLSQYKCSLEVFHEKTGGKDRWKEDNEAMFHGRHQEAYIAKCWQHYDPGDPGAYILNYENEKIIRKCRSLNGSVVNPDYPWLSGSVDRLINKGSVHPLTGEIFANEAVLEIKTISGYEARKWDIEFPPAYLIQLHLYMIILEVEYGEIAVLRDGRYLSVYPIDKRQDLCDRILDETYKFWYEKVVPAKHIRKEMEQTSAIHELQRLEAQLQLLEPPPDTSEAYREYLSKRELEEDVELKGEAEHLIAAQCLKEVQAMKKLIEEKENLYKSTLMKALIDTGCDTMTLDGGKISYRKNKNGVRSLNLSLTGFQPRDKELLIQQYL
jgi:predicted phage-related endonuclease